MKKLLLAVFSLVLGSGAFADDVSKADRLLCSTSKVLLCFEDGTCIEVLPADVGVPQFIIVDTKKKLLSTTEASEENRTTAVENMERDERRILMQGIDLGRAFSILIDAQSGYLTASVSRDGFTVSGFGACTVAGP